MLTYTSTIDVAFTEVRHGSQKIDAAIGDVRVAEANRIQVGHRSQLGNAGIAHQSVVQVQDLDRLRQALERSIVVDLCFVGVERL